MFLSLFLEKPFLHQKGNNLRPSSFKRNANTTLCSLCYIASERRTFLIFFCLPCDESLCSNLQRGSSESWLEIWNIYFFRRESPRSTCDRSLLSFPTFSQHFQSQEGRCVVSREYNSSLCIYFRSQGSKKSRVCLSFVEERFLFPYTKATLDSV